jgi:hypothetical protein
MGAKIQSCPTRCKWRASGVLRELWRNRERYRYIQILKIYLQQSVLYPANIKFSFLYSFNLLLTIIDCVQGLGEIMKALKTKLRGLSPRANYTDRATAACRRSDCQLFADRGCHVVSVTDPYGRILRFLDRSPLLFYQVAPQLYS